MGSVSGRLRKAARAGMEVKVKALLQYPGCDTLAKDKNGITALMEAAWNGHEACVKMLLPKSDALAVKANGMTALMWAADCGAEACVKLLLPVSDVLAKNKREATASDYAKNWGERRLDQLINAYALAQTERAEISAAACPGAPRGRPVLRV